MVIYSKPVRSAAVEPSGPAFTATIHFADERAREDRSLLAGLRRVDEPFFPGSAVLRGLRPRAAIPRSSHLASFARVRTPSWATNTNPFIVRTPSFMADTKG